MAVFVPFIQSFITPSNIYPQAVPFHTCKQRHTHTHTQSMHCTLVHWCHETERVHCTTQTVWVSNPWSTASLSAHRALKTAWKYKPHVHLSDCQTFPSLNKWIFSLCIITICFCKREKKRLVGFNYDCWTWQMVAKKGSKNTLGSVELSFFFLAIRWTVCLCTNGSLLDTEGSSFSSDVSACSLRSSSIISNPNCWSVACQAIQDKQEVCFSEGRNFVSY